MRAEARIERIHRWISLGHRTVRPANGGPVVCHRVLSMLLGARGQSAPAVDAVGDCESPLAHFGVCIAVARQLRECDNSTALENADEQRVSLPGA